jgi:hypothetical protein
MGLFPLGFNPQWRTPFCVQYTALLPASQGNPQVMLMLMLMLNRSSIHLLSALA